MSVRNARSAFWITVLSWMFFVKQYCLRVVLEERDLCLFVWFCCMADVPYIFFLVNVMICSHCERHHSYDSVIVIVALSKREDGKWELVVVVVDVIFLRLLLIFFVPSL